MKALFALLLFVGLFTAPLARAASDVELLVEGDTLVPSTTLELRFARDMIKAEEVGLVATPPPLVVQPALAGTFTWLSKRSGVFTPTEEPAMGTTFTFSLRAGLKDAAGKPVTAKLQTKLKTPPFGVVGGLGGKDARLDSATPPEQFVFNREVNLEGAAALFHFIDARGQTIGAGVHYAKAEEYSDLSGNSDPWEQRWDATHRAEKPRRGRNEEGRDDKPEVLRNRLVIEPLEPLAAGVAWRLEMKPGLRAISGNYTIQRPETSLLGVLVPFAIEKLTTSSYLNSGRSAELTFTRSASEALQDDTAPQYFKITPEVENLHFTTGYDGVSITGYFQRGVDYRLEISPELRDAAGVPFGGERVRTLRFGAVNPRVYLPVIQGHQMAAGQRKFPVTCVNMKSLRVTAQLVAPAKAAEALWTFQDYERRGNHREDERFARLAPADFGGTKVFDRTTVLPNPQPRSAPGDAARLDGVARRRADRRDSADGRRPADGGAQDAARRRAGARAVDRPRRPLEEGRRRAAGLGLLDVHGPAGGGRRGGALHAGPRKPTRRRARSHRWRPAARAPIKTAWPRSPSSPTSRG